MQLEEQDLAVEYEDAAALEMMKVWMGERSGHDAAWIDARLAELTTLVPDLVVFLPTSDAATILALASDIQVWPLTINLWHDIACIDERLRELTPLVPPLDWHWRPPLRVSV